MELSPGELLRVFGPARLTVVRGTVMILGAHFSSGESVEINKYRSYAVRGVDESVVEVRLEDHGSIEKPVEGEEVLDEWVAVADEIVSSGGLPVVVALGPTDAGKSSFTALLVNRALHKGVKPGVRDADIGQADVGPPGFVSATIVDRKILWLRWLRARWLRFVGAISPQRHERRLLAAIAELKHVLVENGAQLIAVDSDGWVQGYQALEYKLELLRVLKPTHVALIGASEDLVAVLSGWAARGRMRVYTLRSPSVVYMRDRGDRRSLRSEAYQRFLEGAQPRRVKLTEVAVIGSCLLSGRLLSPEELQRYSELVGVPVVAGSETPDRIVLVVDGQPRPQALEALRREQNVVVLRRGAERGLYVAVLGEDLEEKAPGVILSIDYGSLEAEVLTSYTGEIGGLIIGHIRLSLEQEYTEEGYISRCPL